MLARSSQHTCTHALLHAHTHTDRDKYVANAHIA